MMEEYFVHEKEEFLSRAKAYLHSDLYEDALKLAESWLVRDFADSDANMILCHVLLKMGRIDKLRQFLDGMDDSIKRLSRTYSFMGDICMNSGLRNEAENFYRKFNAINSAFADPLDVPQELESQASFLCKQDTENQNTYKHSDVEQISPDFQTVTLAEVYIKQGHLKLANDLLLEILKKDPANSAAQETLKKVEAMLIEEDKKSFIVKELTRWLKNIDRIRCHA